MKVNKVILFCLLLLISGSKYLCAQDLKFIHYTNSDGLPYSAITDFVQDRQGLMWVAMRSCLSRFDGYEFVEYFPTDSLGERAPIRIPILLNDVNGDIYVSTMDSRLFRYDELLDRFIELQLPDKASDFDNITEANGGGFWLTSQNRIFFYSTDDNTCTPIEEIYQFFEFDIETEYILKIFDRNGQLFILLESGKILMLNAEFKVLESLTFKEGEVLTDSEGLFHADDNGNVWVADFISGLYRINWENKDIELFSADPEDENKILHNIVRSLTYDIAGKIWIGTENGLNIFDPDIGKMSSYSYEYSNPEGLNSSAIYKLYTDRNGNVWVGTYFGGINLWYAGEEFFSIIDPGLGDYKLSGKQVSCITEDRDGNIWVGLEGDGFNIIDSSTGVIEKFEHIPNRNSLSYNNVHCIEFDSDGIAYIGTYTGGLNIFNPETKEFKFLNTENTSSLTSNSIYDLERVGDSLLIGTDNGIMVYDCKSAKHKKFFPEIFENRMGESFCRIGDEVWISARYSIFIWNIRDNSIRQQDNYLPDASISFIATDSNDKVWIGDNLHGLLKYDNINDSYINYNYSNGFNAPRVYGLIEGEGDWYWISSTIGLLRFNPEKNSLIEYNTRSGLPFNQFNFNAFYKSKAGQLYFGGINGLIYFEDKVADIVSPVEDVVFTSLSVFNEKVVPGENSILPEALRHSESFKLKYSENIFSISFTALNFTHPGRVQYEYMLEDFSNDWISNGNRNSIYFTSLPPGKYLLHVRASFDNNPDSSKEKAIEIIIKPPFYLSALAFMIYFIILIAGLLIFYFVSRKIEQTKALAIIERNEKIQEKKLNQSKLEFFTNVSHELKTPLTLIIGRLTNLVREAAVPKEIKGSLVSVNDNARRLLALINQLMEFRRSDLGKTYLNVSEGDINLFSREIKEAFDYVAELKNMEFSFSNTVPFKAVWFDHEKLERILFNLLSNAFKYTDDGGMIELRISGQSPTSEGIEYLNFEIEDNGGGIKSEELEHIFERFYRTDELSSKKAGSGIGLALVNNLVKLHKGKLEVKSKHGIGSVFSFIIPGNESAYSEEELFKDDLTYTLNTEELIHLEHNNSYHSADPVVDQDKETVLIVDDNTELLSFLGESISGKFNVITAINGKKALEVIAHNKPDIIISDVVMPEMDGYELTEKIKSTIETSHLPVILLSARADVDDKYTGLLKGADAYIEKPFYPHLLLQHVENIMATRKKLISTFKDNLNSKPSDIAQTKSDKDFIEQLSRIIHDNIDNPDLDVSFLVKEMSISRSLLHLKLKKIASCSATGFIRTLRLRKAANLIIEEVISFSEAAYRTGFSSPAFFSRRFKEYFGKTPSQFIEDTLSDR